jgi:hypothetical protein
MNRELKGSITIDSNPEGINQYSGGGPHSAANNKSGTTKIMAKNATTIARAAHAKTGPHYDKAMNAYKPSAAIKAQKTAINSHNKTIELHKTAARMNSSVGNEKQAQFHRDRIKDLKTNLEELHNMHTGDI